MPAGSGAARTVSGAAEHGPAVQGFVDALVQLPGYAPFDTTFAFERRSLASDRFLQAIEQELEARGYGLRVSTTLGYLNDVGHVAERDADGETTRTVSFGPVQMRRRFAQAADGGWSATSSLFIRGADASRVTLGEAGTQAALVPPTRIVASETPAQPSSEPVTAPSLAARRQPDHSGPADPLVTVQGVERASAARADRPAAVAASAVPATPATRNIAELGRSNYAGVFEAYANVEELILVFPNDSMVLGVENKRKIQEVVARVDPERDLFSIIGCSFGKTAIDNGNEVLATGRANRVKEALIFAGVNGERILDEGCWAGAPAENFPGRGVVLTIKRPTGGLE